MTLEILSEAAASLETATMVIVAVAVIICRILPWGGQVIAGFSAIVGLVLLNWADTTLAAGNLATTLPSVDAGSVGAGLAVGVFGPWLLNKATMGRVVLLPNA